MTKFRINIERLALQRILLALGALWQVVALWSHRFDLLVTSNGKFDLTINYTSILSKYLGNDYVWAFNAYPLFIIAFLAGIGLVFNLASRYCSLILFTFFLVVFYRNNFSLNFGGGICSWLLLLHFSSKWLSENQIKKIAFYYTAIFYFLAGIFKIINTEEWVNGTFIEKMIFQSNMFHTFGQLLLSFTPLIICKIITLSILYLEVLYILAIFIPRTRMFFWWFFLGMHLVLIFTWRAGEVSFSLISLQLLSYKYEGTLPLVNKTRANLVAVIIGSIMFATAMYRPVLQTYYMIGEKPFLEKDFEVFYSFPPSSSAIHMFSSIFNIKLSSKLEVVLYSDKEYNLEWQYFGPFKKEWLNTNYSMHRLYWAIVGWQLADRTKYNLMGVNYLKNYYCNFEGIPNVKKIKIRLNKTSEKTDWSNFDCN